MAVPPDPRCEFVTVSPVPRITRIGRHRIGLNGRGLILRSVERLLIFHDTGRGPYVWVGVVEGRVPGVTDPGVALPVAAVSDVDPAPDECCILHSARNLLFRLVSTKYSSHLA